MRFIVYLAVAMLFCTLVTGCDNAPRQYHDYQYDIYTPSGELFTVATVRSVSSPMVIAERTFTGSTNMPTGRVVIMPVNEWGSVVSGSVTVPSGWLVLGHGEKLGEKKPSE